MLDLRQMLKQNDNQDTAKLLGILQNRNDCIYVSASTHDLCTEVILLYQEHIPLNNPLVS